MKIFDAHCDVLLKLWEDRQISFYQSPKLHIDVTSLQKTGSKIQAFALFIPETLPISRKFEVALEMIDIFYEQVAIPQNKIKVITKKTMINQLKEDEIGAILTLEGCDAIGADIEKLRILFRLGVTSVGLTWNHPNLVADGAMEKRGAGLTEFGKRVILENNRHHVWTDVSHVCEKGFWDTMEISDYPIASHSNARALRDHPRNLYDSQIKALIAKKGMIGIAFVPQFLTDNTNAGISDIIRHIDHICSLGGENNIGFGSDFDGIEEMVDGMERFLHYQNLIEELLKQYSESFVKRICFENFYENYPG